MTDWSLYTSCFLSGAMLVMMAIGLIISAIIPAIDRWNRLYFIALFSDLLIYSIVLSVDILTWYNPDMES